MKILYFLFVFFFSLNCVSSPLFSVPNIKNKIKRNRNINHKKAYKFHPELGQHINIKVTPPEKRGKKGFFLVEIYNNSKYYISVFDFDISITNKDWYQLNSHIEVQELLPYWSDAKWLKIPKKVIPEILKIKISHPIIYTKNAKKIKLKIYSDLIKK